MLRAGANQKEDVMIPITFREDLTGCVGIEQEFFLYALHCSSTVSAPTPRSPEFLRRIEDDRWTYELSACQVEVRTAPHRTVSSACSELAAVTVRGSSVAASMECSLVACEYVPDSIPLDVYPSERYHDLAGRLSNQVLLAACQVAGIHVHYGCRDMKHALRVYHVMREYTEVFLRIGDFSSGQRMDRYRRVVPDCLPPV